MNSLQRYYLLLLKPIGVVLALTGFLLSCYAFYPGLMSPDTLDQYKQARFNQYTDWHPPAMAGFWHLLLQVYDGPQPMLIFQLLLLWAAFYIIFLFLTRRYPYFSLFLPILFFSPFILNFAGNIWKDIQLAFSWLLASAIMINAQQLRGRQNILEAIASILLLGYGTWVRSNALPAVLPLCMYWIYTIREIRPTFKGYSLLFAKGITLTALILIAQIAINNLILKAEKNNIEYKLFLHDLLGISRETNQIYFPEFVKDHPGFDFDYLSSHYSYTSFDHFWWNPEGRDLVPRGLSQELVTETRNYWLKTIASEPLAYFKNKFIGYMYFLRIYRSGTRLEIFYPHIHPNEFGFTFSPNRVFEILQKKVEQNAGSVFFEPWFWGLLNVLLLLLICLMLRKSPAVFPALAMSLSSLIYILFMFLVFPADTEFRYFYWNVIALSVCAIITLADIFEKFSAGKSG